MCPVCTDSDNCDSTKEKYSVKETRNMVSVRMGKIRVTIRGNIDFVVKFLYSVLVQSEGIQIRISKLSNIARNSVNVAMVLRE